MLRRSHTRSRDGTPDANRARGVGRARAAGRRSLPLAHRVRARAGAVELSHRRDGAPRARGIGAGAGAARDPERARRRGRSATRRDLRGRALRAARAGAPGLPAGVGRSHRPDRHRLPAAGLREGGPGWIGHLPPRRLGAGRARPRQRGAGPRHPRALRPPGRRRTDPARAGGASASRPRAARERQGARRRRDPCGAAREARAARGHARAGGRARRRAARGSGSHARLADRLRAARRRPRGAPPRRRGVGRGPDPGSPLSTALRDALDRRESEPGAGSAARAPRPRGGGAPAHTGRLARLEPAGRAPRERLLDRRLRAMTGAVPPGIDAPAVSQFFAAHVEGGDVPLSFAFLSGGRSNLTYRVEGGGRTWVLRRPPLGHVLPTAHDMAREHRVLTALRDTGIPVPRTRALCEDASVTGAPFYVMDFAAGLVIEEALPAGYATTSTERRRIGAAAMATLAALHAVDWRALGLADFGRPDGYLARQVRRWSEQWERSKASDVPLVSELIRRLNASLPATPASTLVHGDYRLGNL